MPRQVRRPPLSKREINRITQKKKRSDETQDKAERGGRDVHPGRICGIIA